MVENNDIISFIICMGMFTTMYDGDLCISVKNMEDCNNK